MAHEKFNQFHEQTVFMVVGDLLVSQWKKQSGLHKFGVEKKIWFQGFDEVFLLIEGTVKPLFCCI